MRRDLQRLHRSIDNSHHDFTAAIDRWMRRAVEKELRLAIAQASFKDIETEKELRDLLIKFGWRRADASARHGGLTVPGTLLRNAMERKPVKIKIFQELVDGAEERAHDLSESVKNTVRDNVKLIIRESLEQERRPSLGDVIRRIRNTIHAVGTNADGSDRVYVFSPDRAELIARTELVQAENTGKMAAAVEVDAGEIEWLAYSDGRSGDRHHEKMDGVVIKVGEKFTTPLGNRLRYPGDPLGPIKETANCRCTFAVVS